VLSTALLALHLPLALIFRIIEMRVYFIIVLLITINSLINGQTVKSFKTSDGETLYFTSLGTGPKVVLIPGGPGAGVSSLQMWADSLSQDFECILFDQRGTGLSSRAKLDSTTINIRRATKDLDDLRKFLREEKLTLCGISWGGQLSLAYASFFPEYTRKIVPVSTLGPDTSLGSVYHETILMRRYKNERDSLEYWINQPDNDVSKMKRSFFTMIPYFFDHDMGYKLLPKMIASRKFHKEMSELMFKDIRKNYNLNSRLRNYKNQCIVIRGRHDVVPAEAMYQLMEVMPQTKIYIIERCGHFPHLEQPHEFFPLLRKALGE
jgi:proline iminopeptidase